MKSSINNIIASTSNDSKTPEEALDALAKIGVDCYITREGTLMYRYWQVGTTGFVSPEKAAIIRSTRESPEQSDKLDWLSENLQSIQQDYAGQWVAIYENRIVASANDLPSLMNQITQLDKPFITFIPADEIVWNFAYAIKKF